MQKITWLTKAWNKFFFLLLTGSALWSEEPGIDKTFNRILKSTLDFSVPTLTPAQAVTNKDYIFLDAREEDEFRVSHVSNARWIGYNDFSLERLKGIPKDQPVILYCSIGYRSEKIGEKLQKEGYTRVYNLYGSIFAWINAGYPVYRSGSPTEDIHPYNRVWGLWLKKGNKTMTPPKEKK